ncbi:MAG: hypothetical protein ACRDS0_09145 [Pseudonocardiaceae bacterium]
MRRAEADIRAWVVDLRGGFDAGSGAKFDGRLDGVGTEWHTQESKQHDHYLTELDLRIAAAQRHVTKAADTVANAEKKLRHAEHNFDIARQRLGGERLHTPTSTDLVSSPADQSARTTTEPAPSRMLGGPHYQAPELLHGPSRDGLMWLFVLGAIIGDLAAFYVVLAGLFGAQPVIILAGTIGFSAAAIGICHHIGVGLRKRRSGDRVRSDGLLWAEKAGWVALGGVAFAARLRYGVPPAGISGSTNFGVLGSDSGADQDLIAALTFAGLYFVSGLVAMTTSFHTFNPAARAYLRASRKLKQATQQVTIARGHHAEQQGRLKAVQSEESRAIGQRAAAYRRTNADVVSLKILVRHRMAAELQDPRALDLLMKDAPTIDEYPEPGA